MFIAAKGIIAATLFTALASTSTATAQDMIVNEDGSRSIEVSFADINMENADGQRRVETRIRSAAKRVCGDSPKRVVLVEGLAIRSCVKLAQTNAMATLPANATGPVRIAVRTEADYRRN